MSNAPRIGLWANDRGPMASGNSGGIRFVLWRNDKKAPGSNQPDYHLVMEAPQKREDQSSGGRSGDKSEVPPMGGGGMDDSIPFFREDR